MALSPGSFIDYFPSVFTIDANGYGDDGTFSIFVSPAAPQDVAGVSIDNDESSMVAAIASDAYITSDGFAAVGLSATLPSDSSVQVQMVVYTGVAQGTTTDFWSSGKNFGFQEAIYTGPPSTSPPAAVYNELGTSPELKNIAVVGGNVSPWVQQFWLGYTLVGPSNTMNSGGWNTDPGLVYPPPPFDFTIYTGLDVDYNISGGQPIRAYFELTGSITAPVNTALPANSEGILRLTDARWIASSPPPSGVPSTVLAGPGHSGALAAKHL